MSNLVLKHGDCLALMKEIPSSSVDAIITDPPYGTLHHKIETAPNLALLFQEWFRVLKTGGFLAFFGKMPTMIHWCAEAEQHHFKFKQHITWYKKQGSSPVHELQRYHEEILIYGKKTVSKYFTVTGKYTDVKFPLAEFIEIATLERHLTSLWGYVKNPDSYEKLKQQERVFDQERLHNNAHVTLRRSLKAAKVHIYKEEVNLGDFWGFGDVLAFTAHNKKFYGKPEYNIPHPTVKPIDLMTRLVELLTKSGDTVLDPFMGSGTTGLACQERNFIGMEIFADYYQLAKDRIAAKNLH
jgi:DNA modification methylase